MIGSDVFIIPVFISVTLYSKNYVDARNRTCGLDNSKINEIYEGAAKIETYPWLGYLVYDSGKHVFTSPVVLITKQLVLGTALDIDKLPKHNFRARAKVVLGSHCKKPGFSIREYVFHPEYARGTLSAIAIIQLDITHNLKGFRPICQPPSYLENPRIYAITMSDGCKNPKLKIFEMIYVSPEKCKSYYRRSNLDFDYMWPKHTACARARYGGECRWQSGTILALRQEGRWRLLGYGIFGPGCEAPSRFVDYGMYHEWIRRKVIRAGRPAITRIGENEVILRRSMSNIQRFGACDEEEAHHEIYSDQTTIEHWEYARAKHVSYNVTIYSDVEYSCVVFRASNLAHNVSQPSLRLRRWCSGDRDMCQHQQYMELDFSVEINFKGPMKYQVRAYGLPIQSLDPKSVMFYINSLHETRLPSYETIRKMWFASRDDYDPSWMHYSGAGSTLTFWGRFPVRNYYIIEKCRNHWNYDCYMNEVMRWRPEVNLSMP